MKISTIAALDQGRGIGKDNGLLWKLPDDLQRFKRLTLGRPLVMGRRTYESIGRPLPGRKMIVITTRLDYQAPGCELAASPQAALDLCQGEPEVMIAGGGTIYRQFLPLADRQYLTYVQASYEADCFYPNFPMSEWRELAREPHPQDERNQHDFVFVTLERDS